MHVHGGRESVQFHCMLNARTSACSCVHARGPVLTARVASLLAQVIGPAYPYDGCGDTAPRRGDLLPWPTA
eukprot:1769419-Pleurochrysis_carterae.AAC.5